MSKLSILDLKTLTWSSMSNISMSPMSNVFDMEIPCQTSAASSSGSCSSRKQQQAAAATEAAGAAEGAAAAGERRICI
jgi:hypothetical protein